MIMQRSIGALKDFVPGNFPEPWNPIWQANWDQHSGTGQAIVALAGLKDFVPGNFPEPHNPIAPGMGCSGGCGGSCSDCGMGSFAVPAFAATWPAPLNGVDPVLGIPWVYWGGGVAALVVVPMLFGKRGRR